MFGTWLLVSLEVGLVALGSLFSSGGEENSASGAAWKVGLGEMDGESSDGSGDNIGGLRPHVQLFNSVGESIGFSNPMGARLGRGQSFQTTIDTSRTADYVRVTAASEDEICIAYVTVSSEGGQDFLTWNGNWGRECDMPWYPSSRRFPGTQIVPDCVWISLHSNDHPAAFSVRIRDFSWPDSESAQGVFSQLKANTDFLCNAPGRQQFYSDVPMIRNIYDEYYIRLEDSCIPYYPYRDLNMTYEEGDVLLQDKILRGHRCHCDNPGTAWNEVDLCPSYEYIGAGQFGGSPGYIPVEAAAPEGQLGGSPGYIPVEYAAPEGQFGGSPGYIPVEDAAPTEHFGGRQGYIPVENAAPTEHFGGSHRYIPVEDAAPMPSGTDEIGSTLTTQSPTESLTPTQSSTFATNDPLDTIGGQWPYVNTTHIPSGSYSNMPPLETSTSSSLTSSPTFIAAKRASSGPTPFRRTPSHKAVLQRRTELKARNHKCTHTLNISHLSSHSARKVCASTSSYGGDFVSTSDGLYCDLCEHELWPLCDSENGLDEDCFSLGERKLVTSRSARKRRVLKGRTTATKVEEDELEEFEDKQFKSVNEWK